jgi:hypothetical protein
MARRLAVAAWLVAAGPPAAGLVVMPGSDLLLQCSGPVGEVRQCVWRDPTGRCCYGDCGAGGCPQAGQREVRREVRGAVATCQLHLADLQEGEGGAWRCDLGLPGGAAERSFTVARAGVLEWVGGVQPGVRKLEGDVARVGCRVRGARPRGELSWALGDTELDVRLQPVTEWEEETAEGRVWGLQQSVLLPDLAGLAGASLYCRHSQRDHTGRRVERGRLEAVVLGPRPAALGLWAAGGGLLLLLPLGLGLGWILARARARRPPPPLETPL